MEVPFINLNVSQKSNFTQFSDLCLCLLYLKNNQPEIILMLKRHILGWQILLPLSAHTQGARVGVGQGQGTRRQQIPGAPHPPPGHAANQLEMWHFHWPLTPDLAGLASAYFTCGE